MNELKHFTRATARPLPVILLADVSGSMAADGKIDALNSAVAEMLRSFSEEEDIRAEIHVAAITFGGGVSLHLPPTPTARATWPKMGAAGDTPLGAALQAVTSLLENRDLIPGRAYTPTLVLVSDGQPTDAWEEPLSRLLASERARKAVRLAMGIGADADAAVLERFVANPEIPVFRADQAGQVREFFRWVTLSVRQRSRSANPNLPLLPSGPVGGEDADF